MTSPERVALGRLQQHRAGHLRPWVWVLTAALVLLSGLRATPAEAVEAEGGPAGSVRLTVTELTGVLGPGSLATATDDLPVVDLGPQELGLRVLVENDGTVRLDALRVVIEIHPAVDDRAQLHAALQGELTTQPLTVRVSPELDVGRDLVPGEMVGLAEAITPAEVEWAEGPGGVHPVRIAVTRGTEVLDEVVTAVVWIGPRPAAPLLTTVVWPLQSPPWRTVGGAYPEGSGREVRPGGRLDALVTAAELANGVPVVLAPAAHLLEDLEDRSDGFEVVARGEGDVQTTARRAAGDPDATFSRQALQRIRELATIQRFPPVSGSYADADLVAIGAAGTDLLELAGIAATEGRRRVGLQLGTPTDTAVHLVDGPLSPDVLDLLPSEAVLLPGSAITLADADDGVVLRDPVRTLQAPSGRRLTALIADPHLEATLARTAHRAGPLVAAQSVLAETAAAYLEDPAAGTRGLVLLPPPTWDPSPRAARTLLEGLQRATWLELAPPSRLVGEARRSGAPVALATPDTGPFPESFVTSLGRARTGLRSLAAARPDPSELVDGRPFAALEDDLLRSTSRWYRAGPAETPAALVRDVQGSVTRALGQVEVSSGRITLTSDAGQVPVTLRRTRGEAINVVVAVESQGSLLWPEGRRSQPVLVTEAGPQTVSFATRALSTGTFPVKVRVTDPTGQTTIATTTLSVRSTALSGVALTAIGVVVLALLLFGSFRRREPEPGLALVHTASPPEGSQGPQPPVDSPP